MPISGIRYGTADIVRKRAHDISTDYYTDAEINDIIDRYSILIHRITGKPTTDAYDATEQPLDFDSARTYVINMAAAEIMGGIAELEEAARLARQIAEDVKNALIKGGMSAIQTSHYDIVQGVDPDHYSQQF